MESFISKEKSKQLVNVVLVLFVILSLFFFFKFINEIKKSGHIGREVGMQNSISVSGMGEVVALPDVATFSFTVREEFDEVSKAQEDVTNKMNAILDALKTEGIEEKDIKTTGYNIYPQYDYSNIQCLSYPCPPSRQTLRGYEVSHSVMIKVQDTEKTGDLLELVGSFDVDNVSGISFSIDDTEAPEEEARSLAIKDAQKQAEKLADDLGVKLVRVMSFYENNYPGPYYYDSYAMMGKGDAALGEGGRVSPTIPTGENTIQSQVTITYEIR